MWREKSSLECAGLTALFFSSCESESGVKPPHSKRAVNIHDPADQTAAKMYIDETL
jgi:hypothetical protein